MRVKQSHKNKTTHAKYARYEASATFGYGAGPLRPRVKQDETFGRCQGWCDKSQDEELFGGLCKWCRWIKNDKEANEEWD